MALKRKANNQQPKQGVKRALETSQLDDDAFTTPTKAARKTRSAEYMASRTVMEQFSEFTDHQKHVIRAEANENNTLQEDLVFQNELRMTNSSLAVKMGKIYYSHQRSLYQLEDSHIKRLETLDNGNPDIT